MQTFRFIVFLLAAIGLPCAAIALMKANMKTIGKTILFIVLAVAARYLLGAVWTPDEMWQLWVKCIVVTAVFYVLLLQVWATFVWAFRPWASFIAFMAVPLLVKYVFFGTDFGYRRGTVAFWVGWVTLGALRSVMIAFARKGTWCARAFFAVVAIGLLSLHLSQGAETKVCAHVENLCDYLRSNIVERWEPIRSSAEKIVAAWDELVAIDRRAMAQGKIGAQKIVASADIKAKVKKLREDLLTVDSRAVLKRITELDEDIASAKKSLSALREQRGLEPSRAEKLGEKISEAEAELTGLESARAEAVATARRDLKEIGLSLPENSPLLTVDLGALIDNAIVAKNIGFVVENLKTFVEAEKGDPEAAKRYYGAYIVMLDVQSECFRQYLDKAATGIWRDGIVDVAKDAEAAKKGNEIKAAAGGRSEEEKKAFLHAAATNEKTLKAAQAYLALLKHHEEIIREKLVATEKRHEIALSFWESVDIASAFGAKAISDMADLEALLELKLPEITYFDDVAMQTEFDAITKKLMKE